MKTSAFLTALRAHAGLPLVFRTADAAISSHYHLTEVKRVSYETMDCGAMTHRWSETQFELWVPPLVGALPGRDHMKAGKFLAIVDRVEKELPLDGETSARVFVSLGDHPAALHDVASVVPVEGILWINLTTDRARCKAAERRVCNLVGGCGDNANGGADAPCCSAEPKPEPAAACCGSAAPAATAACCT